MLYIWTLYAAHELAREKAARLTFTFCGSKHGGLRTWCAFCACCARSRPLGPLRPGAGDPAYSTYLHLSDHAVDRSEQRGIGDSADRSKSQVMFHMTSNAAAADGGRALVFAGIEASKSTKVVLLMLNYRYVRPRKVWRLCDSNPTVCRTFPRSRLYVSRVLDRSRRLTSEELSLRPMAASSIERVSNCWTTGKGCICSLRRCSSLSAVRL